MDNEKHDEILGISRCARCGHRLEGEIECPFCSLFPDAPKKERVPKWTYITACFLTSPFSLYFIIRTERLSRFEKALAFSGCLLWIGMYRLWL
ncbi:MAG: hypothetical protein HY808_04065 [Nitrospirae bacterium]|nr:hypothetical protein [Nitrospirota bacterium]